MALFVLSYARRDGENNMGSYASGLLGSVRMLRTNVEGFDIEELRQRLRKMTNDELRKFGREAMRMLGPKGKMGQTATERLVIQLAEARAEWAERKTKPTKT